ncbi:MAG: hypothetical protein NZ891_01210 [bacterium]|nr:hypothetical protein [bacterium]MDW8163348.1 hypothetical protein [Candidatus Omnitrophota bacterium]
MSISLKFKFSCFHPRTFPPLLAGDIFISGVPSFSETILKSHVTSSFLS